MDVVESAAFEAVQVADRLGEEPVQSGRGQRAAGKAKEDAAVHCCRLRHFGGCNEGTLSSPGKCEP